MKFPILAATVAIAVLASTAATTSELMFGLDNESSSEQGERSLTCSSYPKCRPKRVCKEDLNYQCPDGILDFNDECFFDVADGKKGPYISKLPAFGVNITARRKKTSGNTWNDWNTLLTGENVARLLDSGDGDCMDGTYADPDMMTPNEDFCYPEDWLSLTKDELENDPVVKWNYQNHQCDTTTMRNGVQYTRGLGKGHGGKSGKTWENNKHRGNILIVEEEGLVCAADNCPDDNAKGGQIVFKFYRPMTVDYLELMDIDDPLPEIRFYYQGGGFYTMTAEQTGNNGIWTKQLVAGDSNYPLQENVDKIRFRFPSSGGISAIHYYCPEAHSNGDPHFTTWSGDHFDFQGECDLVLVNNPTFKTDMGMHIHGRTKLHGSWSAFSSIAVKMGDDVLEVHGSAAPFINGVELQVAPVEYGAEVLLPIKLSGYDVSIQNTGPNSRKYIIHLGNGERIFINNFKEFVDLDIENVQSSEFMGSSGLLGNFNTGSKLARDGKTIIDNEDVLGQEWQVTDTDPQLFTLVEGPQYPAKCNMPEKLSASQRHLRALNKKVSEDDARSACVNAKPDRMQNCIADVFGSDDIDMAGIYTVHSF